MNDRSCPTCLRAGGPAHCPTHHEDYARAQRPVKLSLTPTEAQALYALLRPMPELDGPAFLAYRKLHNALTLREVKP